MRLVHQIQSEANAADLMICIDSVRANGLGLQQGRGGPRTFKAQLIADGPFYDAMSFTSSVRKTRLDVIEVGDVVVLKYYSKPGRNPRQGEIKHLMECVGPNARWDGGELS